MVENQQQSEVSFNPDDATGLIDNVRAKLTAVKVDVFTSKSIQNAGAQYVNVEWQFKSDTGEFVERDLLGPATEWAPNKTKTGVVSLTGKGIWNKSDIFQRIKSFIDAGFPKTRVSTDLSVFVGGDYHLNRVVQEGKVRKNTDGTEGKRTILLVSKVYALPGEKPGRAAGTTAKANGSAGEATIAVGDDYAQKVLAAIVADKKGSVPLNQIPQAAFIHIMRDKQAPAGNKKDITAAVQAKLADEAFLLSLAEQNVIGFDGSTVTTA